MIQKIRQLIAKGEKDKVEFKKAQHGLPANLYGSVCAFLNTKGGHVLLGVDDNGNITGVAPEAATKIKQDFANAMNNNQVINPAFCISLEEIIIDEKIVLYAYVPETSFVHKYKNKIYLRNNEGDYDITRNQSIVANLYSRKEKLYSENTIYPAIKLDDLRDDLIARVRNVASLQRTGHPWEKMRDFDILKNANLYQADSSTGQEGFTLAAVLLFGKDEVISSVLPHHRTDLIVRIKDTDRYDDRGTVYTNLIESYDRILAFIGKHLPSPFYLENEVRIDLRGRVFREIAANILMHREYSNPFIAKLVIEKDKIYAENSNTPYIYGIIDPNDFTPKPKNPKIAKVFREIGWAEELGSGVRNLYKYCKKYTGFDPVISDDNVFKITMRYDFSAQDTPQDKTPLDKDFEKTGQDTPQDTPQVEEKIIEFCIEPKSKKEIMEYLGYKDRKNFNIKLNKLMNKGLIKQTIPDKPTSKNQKYVATTEDES